MDPLAARRYPNPCKATALTSCGATLIEIAGELRVERDDTAWKISPIEGGLRRDPELAIEGMPIDPLRKCHALGTGSDPVGARRRGQETATPTFYPVVFTGYRLGRCRL